MKRIVICAAALGLLASAPLYAQNADHRGDNHDVAAPERGKSERPAPQQNRPNQSPPPQHQPARSNGERSYNTAVKPSDAMQLRPPVNDRMGHSNQLAVARQNRPDIGAFRRNLQAPQQFHGGNYHAPQGYRYRHWSYGETLPRGYFLRNYWIANFTMYGLFAPPADLIWVRVGNDALLIDRDSGDIVQVRYGVFY